MVIIYYIIIKVLLSDDTFFNWNWTGAYRDRCVGTGIVTGPVCWF